MLVEASRSLIPIVIITPYRYYPLIDVEDEVVPNSTSPSLSIVIAVVQLIAESAVPLGATLEVMATPISLVLSVMLGQYQCT